VNQKWSKSRSASSGSAMILDHTVVIFENSSVGSCVEVDVTSIDSSFFPGFELTALDDRFHPYVLYQSIRENRTTWIAWLHGMQGIVVQSFQEKSLNRLRTACKNIMFGDFNEPYEYGILQTNTPV
jgi:hypothetical protein